MLNPAYELYFWSGIMRDHGEFMIEALSSREPYFIQNAQYFKNSFGLIHNNTKVLLNQNECSVPFELVNHTTTLLANFVSFKQMILKKLLTCGIEINVPPSFINHMINEAMEFYKVLCMLQVGRFENTPSEIIELHKIWLTDASGHAAAIASELDAVEAMYVKEANKFKKDFLELCNKARELGSMLERTCLSDGALYELNKEVDCKMTEFIEFLKKMKTLRMECRILGFFKPLLPDHMIREELYYLSRVKAIS